MNWIKEFTVFGKYNIMKRYDLINFLIEKFKYKTYLEIGLDAGECFRNIRCETKISVDPAEGKYAHANPTHRMTSDNFFKNNLQKFDMIFIDGLHQAYQVEKDIQNSVQSLSENGTIVLHDANPETELCQLIPRQSEYWLGDTWKAIVKYRSTNSNPGCKVLRLMPNEEDCGIIKHNINSEFKLTLPDELTYSWLEKNRNEAIGLVTNVNEFLNNL